MPKRPSKTPPQPPEVLSTRKARADHNAGIVLAVYAPFGTDETLSRFPDVKRPIAPIKQQPLVLALQKVAAEGVNVSALIDLFDDDSYLVEIPAFSHQAISIVSAWKQDMSAPQALAGFLRRTHQRFGCSTLVLALEGHGGAFVPDIDVARITSASVSNWMSATDAGKVRWVQAEEGTTFEDEDPMHPLGIQMPTLPMPSPVLPTARLPLSTWAIGAALASAIKSGVPRPAVIHFNNCFNASVEVLHTVAPYADFATGYANYDFFTGGSAYPAVFKKLRQASPATPELLARLFALENQFELSKVAGHPTLGAVVPLALLRKRVAPALDELSKRLTVELRAVTGAARLALRQQITDAAIKAQHYDTVPPASLKVPDQFMDLASFAAQLEIGFGPGPVRDAAAVLKLLLAPFKIYGETGVPGFANDPAIVYDFSDKNLGLNIFFPDPTLQGKWDWRSPYYLSGTVDPKKPPAHRHVIDFLADGPTGQRPSWVEFIVEYHRDVKFASFFAVQPFVFPLFTLKKGDIPGKA
jgi:hypothetical protein